MPNQFDLPERLLAFGVRIIKAVESLPKNVVGRTLADQLLRSGLSVGANFEEAQGAESHADFVHKLQIALKEARETNYWLRVVDRAAKVPHQRLVPLLDESIQLVAILSKAVATTKGTSKTGK